MKTLATIPKPPVLRDGERPDRNLCNPTDLLLCILSAPQGNSVVEKNWSNYESARPAWLVGIGTNDQLCKFPGGTAVATIGDMSDGFRRIMLLVDWCLNCIVYKEGFMAFNHFAIAGFDTVFRGELPKVDGVAICDGVFMFDRTSGLSLLWAMAQEVAGYMDYRSPKKQPSCLSEFVANSCERALLKVQQTIPIPFPPKILIDEHCIDV